MLIYTFTNTHTQAQLVAMVMALLKLERLPTTKLQLIRDDAALVKEEMASLPCPGQTHTHNLNGNRL